MSQPHEQQRKPRPTAVRVSGLPRTDAGTAESTVRKTIDENSTENLQYKVSIVPACDRSNQLVALVDFPNGTPSFLSSLKKDPSKSYEIATDDDEDLSFDCHFNGFTQLYDVPNEEDIQADVIAICGMGGHAYGSWQGRGNTHRMWLRHFLQRDLPMCRVITYGYNSKLNRRNIARSEDYTNEFLGNMRRIRVGQARQRPVIFVAHSFGGLIVAQSLLKANQMGDGDHPAIATLHRATYGILFFAVPQRGLDVEDMSQIMGADDNPTAGLLDQIKKDSLELQGQLRNFKNILYDRKIVSFHETEQSNRLQRTETGEWKRSGEPFTSLDRDHAILDLPEYLETKVPLHCDHSDVIKYDNKNQEGYSRALDHLQEFVSNAPEVVSNRFQFSPYNSPRLVTQSMQSLSLTRHDSDTVPPLLPRRATSPRETPGPPKASTNPPKAQSSPQIEELQKKHDVASSYQNEGKNAAAETMYLEVLPAREKLLGSDDADTLQTMHNLGVAENKLGKYAEAQKVLSKALAGRETQFGPGDPVTLDTVHVLGFCHGGLGKYAEAEALYRRAFEGREKELGPTHIDTLRSLHNLGWSCANQNKNSEAENLYKKCLTGRESNNALGPDHADTIMTASNLSYTYEKLKKWPEAETMCLQVLSSRQRTLGANHATTKAARERYDELYGMNVLRGLRGKAKSVWNKLL